VGHYAKRFNLIHENELHVACKPQNPSQPGFEQCYFEAYVRKYIFEKANLKKTSFWCPQKEQCPPGTYYQLIHKDGLMGPIETS
jgi:hypothetical protein